jgi:hypothetical protein
MHLFFDCPMAQHIWKRTGTHPLHSGLVNIWKMSPSGSAVRGVPSPESEVRQIRPVVEAQGADAVDHGVRVDGARWMLSGVEDRRLPVHRGAPPIQGLKGGVAAVRHRHILLTVDEDGIQEDLVVFFIFVLDLSVRTMV